MNFNFSCDVCRDRGHIFDTKLNKHVRCNCFLTRVAARLSTSLGLSTADLRATPNPIFQKLRDSGAKTFALLWRDRKKLNKTIAPYLFAAHQAGDTPALLDWSAIQAEYKTFGGDEVVDRRFVAKNPLVIAFTNVRSLNADTSYTLLDLVQHRHAHDLTTVLCPQSSKAEFAAQLGGSSEIANLFLSDDFPRYSAED